MNRGSEDLAKERALAKRRFNEAPIHESGKLLLAATESSRMSGFNEAPIHESGKS